MTGGLSVHVAILGKKGGGFKRGITLLTLPAIAAMAGPILRNDNLSCLLPQPGDQLWKTLF